MWLEALFRCLPLLLFTLFSETRVFTEPGAYRQGFSLNLELIILSTGWPVRSWDQLVFASGLQVHIAMSVFFMDAWIPTQESRLLNEHFNHWVVFSGPISSHSAKGRLGFLLSLHWICRLLWMILASEQDQTILSMYMGTILVVQLSFQQYFIIFFVCENFTKLVPGYFVL